MLTNNQTFPKLKYIKPYKGHVPTAISKILISPVLKHSEKENETPPLLHCYASWLVGRCITMLAISE